MTLLVLVLAGLRWQWSVRDQAVVFAVDASASARAGKVAAEGWLNRALGGLRGGDAAGIVETVPDALKRECREEIGVEVDPAALKDVL